MSFEQYPEYRDCDRGWVSRLPKNWKLTQLRHIAHIYAGGTPDRNNPDFWTNGTVPWLNSGSVNDWCITSPSEWITDLAASGGHTRWVPPKSVVVALAGQGKTKGMAARLEFRSTCNQSMAAIVPNNLLEYRFLQFWITANYENVRNLAGGDLRDGLNLQHIGGIYIPLPSVGEQEAIANFLDHETAEIDAFIADQERLIELLEERRVATITHAVTKGLDPKVPMKDSGIDWLGQVPSGWRVHAIKLGTYMVGGTGFPHKFQGVTDEAVAFHKVSALGTADADGIIRKKRDTVSYATARELGATVFPAGSIVLAKIGAALLLGRIRSVEHPFCIDNNMLAVTPRGQIDRRFLYYALQIVDFSQIVNPGAVPSLDMTAFRDYKLAFPSREEQSNIAEFLDREMAELDAAISDAREAIALSRERRAALISAAVTGQLDVSQAQRPVGEVLEDEVWV